MNPIARAISLAGGPVELTRRINRRLARPVSYQAVRKWALVGRLPRTDHTGETHYATAIAEAVQDQVTAAELLSVGIPAGAVGADA